MVSVGVDIGGTGVRAAVVAADGSVGPVHRVALDQRRPEAVVQAVARAVERAASGAEVGRLGVGVPGFVRDGVVLGSPNFPAFRDLDLKRLLADHTGADVVVHNDANAAALGAWRRHAAGRDLVLLTLGTGVGGGVVSRGRLLTGRRGVAGELGHVDVGGEVACGCGARGCLEGWLGTEGLRRRAEAQGLAIDDGAELFARADDDERAERLVSEAVDALARGLRTLLVVFAPEVLAFAGGLSLARPRLQPAVDRAVAAAIPAAVDQLEVRWLGRADELAIAGAVETP